MRPPGKFYTGLSFNLVSSIVAFPPRIAFTDMVHVQIATKSEIFVAKIVREELKLRRESSIQQNFGSIEQIALEPIQLPPRAQSPASDGIMPACGVREGLDSMHLRTTA